MDLRTLGELTEMDKNAYFFAKNYAAAATPFLCFSPSKDTIEINGRLLPVHHSLAHLPLYLEGVELGNISGEPSVSVAFTHAGKHYKIDAFLGSQKYEPPRTWQWSFRWSDVPPYYLPDAARASFNATPLRSVCDDCLVVWLNEAGQMLGLPVSIISIIAEAGEGELIATKTLQPRAGSSFFTLSRTPTGAIYATVKFTTPPLTADDVRQFCSLGAARYTYLSKSGSLMPIEVSGSFSWSAVGTGECATFEAKIYSKNVTYAKS